MSKKMRQGGRIPDKKRKQILATYFENENYSETARIHGVSRTTVKNIRDEEPDFCETLQDKKEEHTQDVLTYLDNKRDTVITFIDKYMEAMMDDKKIEAASVNQLSTAFGTVIDKFAMVNTGKNEELLSQAKKLLDGVDSAF